jgi:mono/diheme cytochrome c family protein
MKTKFSPKIAVGALLLSCLLGWSARAGDVNQIWEKNCASCHGKDGKGETVMGRKRDVKNLTDPKDQASFTDAEAVKAIKEGMNDKDTGKERMKAFGDKLSDDDIKALVAKARSFKPAQ